MTAPRRTTGRTRKTRAQLQEEVDGLRALMEGRTQPTSQVAAQLGIPLAGDGDIDRMMTELGAGSGTVTLWRTRRDGRPEYVRAFELGEWSLEAVREEYGGGSYLAKFLDGDGGELGQRQFIVADPKPAPVTADQLAVDLARIREREREVRTPAPASSFSGDPMGMFVALTQAATENTKSMMAMLAPLLAPKDDTLTREILVTLLKREPAGPETFFEMFEKARDLLGDGGGSGDYGDVIRELGRPLAALMTRSVENGNGSAAGQNGRPQLPPGGAPQAPEVPPVKVAAETPFLILRPYMARLLRLAGQNASPALWAPALAVEFEAQINLLIAVVDRVGADAALDALVQTFPDADPFRDWFGRLLGEFMAGAVDPDDSGQED